MGKDRKTIMPTGMRQTGSDLSSKNTNLLNGIQNLKTESYGISVTENRTPTQYQKSSNGQLAEVSSQSNANTDSKENISTVKSFETTDKFDSKSEPTSSAQEFSSGQNAEASDEPTEGSTLTFQSKKITGSENLKTQPSESSAADISAQTKSQIHSTDEQTEVSGKLPTKMENTEASFEINLSTIQIENADTPEIDNDDAKTAEIGQDLTKTSSMTPPCVCPSTSTTASTQPTTPGIITPSGDCVCSDVANSLAEEETSTNMPITNGRRRSRKEIEEMDLYVDDFDQKILKKMPFLKFY